MKRGPAGALLQRPWLLTYASAALLVLLFHFRLAWPGNALVSNDIRGLFIALRTGLANTVRAGEWPFWQRGMYLGYPLLGDIQPALFDPLTWLFLPLNAARGLTLQTLAHLCLAAAGMVFWMRQRGLRPVEALFAAVAFALCLKQTVHLHHWTFAGSTCAWPWMLAGLDGFARTGRGRFLALTSFATAATFFGASPQMAWFGSMMAGAYALALAPQLWRRRRADAVLAVLCLPLGLLLAAPLLLPVQELTQLGPRGAGVTYRFAASWSWPGRSVWPLLLLPRAWGSRSDFRGPLNYWELQGYLGLLPMVFALAAPLRKNRLWVFAAVLTICVWFSFGDSAWLDLHRLGVQALPGYGSFRNPTRAMMLAALCIAVLSAEGLGRLRDELPRSFSLRARLLSGIAALGAAALLLWSAPIFGSSSQPYLAALLRLDAEVALGLLALSAVCVWFTPGRARVALLAIPLFLADVGVQTRDAPEIGLAAEEGRALRDFTSQIPARPAPRRVDLQLPWGATNNATYLNDWEGVTGYTPTPLARVLALLGATQTGAIRLSGPLDDDVNFVRLHSGSDLVPLFSTPQVVLGNGQQQVLRTLPALPRVFFTSAVEIADDAHVSGPLHRAARGELVVLSEPFPLGSTAAGPPVAATEIEVQTNRLSATVTAPRDGLAVILEPFFPGWTATLDGEPAPLLRADYAFEAVPVRVGVHRLVLTYFPTRLVPGLLVSALATLALWFSLRQRRRVALTADPPAATFPPLGSAGLGET